MLRVSPVVPVWKFSIGLVLLIFVAAGRQATAQGAHMSPTRLATQNPGIVSPKSLPLESSAPNDTRGEVPGDPTDMAEDMKRLYKIINIYRSRHQGDYPPNAASLLSEVESSMSDPQVYGLGSVEEIRGVFMHPDNRYSHLLSPQDDPERICIYQISNKRPDGTLIGSSKPAGTRDVLAWTSTYYHPNVRFAAEKRAVSNPVGLYLVLWDDGEVQKIPYDQIIYAYENRSLPGRGRRNNPVSAVTFPGQAGVLPNCHTYDDRHTKVLEVVSAPRGKPVARGQVETIPDNGGPESLIALSRLLSAPIERERMWQVFEPAQAEFSLENVQSGAARLGLNLQLRNLTLDELAQQNSPAILHLSDANRVVTLASLDTQQAIVLDQGMTRIVSRDVLGRRYSGQALVPPIPATTAATGPRAVADDAVREIELRDASQEVTQQVTISNTGRQALTLQLEHPTCGCTEAELSSATVAPGQKATLNLTLRWRSVLKGDTQNVFVFVRTNDPLRPRLQLGFQLRLAKA